MFCVNIVMLWEMVLEIWKIIINYFIVLHGLQVVLSGNGVITVLVLEKIKTAQKNMAMVATGVKGTMMVISVAMD